MTAPTPPPSWQLSTFSANEFVPRWIRQTLPAVPEHTDVPRPQFTSAPVRVRLGEPSIAITSWPVLSIVRLSSFPVPIGTVERTAPPGAASSPWELRGEKLAATLAESIAATEITESYEAGYELRVFPALPAAATERI